MGSRPPAAGGRAPIPADYRGPARQRQAAPLARGTVVRNNHLHNNSRIELTGAVKDVVVEHNLIENSDVGISVETAVAGALVRENKFVNVCQPSAGVV